jgi:predicted RNA-binding protein with PUA-like domain
MHTMPTFLLKTEPSEYSLDSLVRDGRTVWSGITNNAALAHLRTARKGDHAFIYHTGDERAIVGVAAIVSDPYEDPAKPGRTAAGTPKFAVVDLTAGKPARRPLTLETMKADRRFAVPDFALLRQSRLSVMPVPEKVEAVIRELTGL